MLVDTDSSSEIFESGPVSCQIVILKARLEADHVLFCNRSIQIIKHQIYGIILVMRWKLDLKPSVFKTGRVLCDRWIIYISFNCKSEQSNNEIICFKQKRCFTLSYFPCADDYPCLTAAYNFGAG